MFGGVVVHDIQSLSMMPSLGAMLGTAHSPEVLEHLNMASGGGVIFGQPGDPYRERYQHLRDVLMTNLQLADNIVSRARTVIMEPEKIVPITSEEDLRMIPTSMHLPILTYAPIRTLLTDHRIDGFGVDPDFLPEEDVYGRLCNNGRVSTFEHQDEVTWCWRSDDPKLTDEDLEAIQATRDFIDSWLVEQMRPGGMFKDPTDLENRISQKKSNKD